MDVAGEDCEAIMLLLGDQPGVKAEFIDFSVSSWSVGRSWASATSYRGELGHPFVFARETFGKLHGDKAVWKLIEAYPDRVSRVEIEAPLTPTWTPRKTTKWPWPIGAAAGDEKPNRPGLATPGSSPK